MNDRRQSPNSSRLPGFLERMLDLAVIPGDRADEIRIKRLFTGAVWMSIPTSAVSVFQLYVFDAPWAAAAVGFTIVVAAIALISMTVRPLSFPGVMHLIAAGTIATTVVMSVLFGGVYEAAGNGTWSVLVIVGAAAVFADRRAHIWLGIFILGGLTAFVLSQRIEPLYTLPNREYVAIFNLLVVGAFTYAVLYYFVRQSNRLYRESERLLRNILPDEVADRLKVSGEMIADRFESASILFADVADFTPMAAQLEPEQTVTLLNEVFTSFDSLVIERGLEKIKTIGDAYMVAAGVPVERDDHAHAICDLALAMQDHLERETFAGRRIEMRVGIASGPITAGIIGKQKFAYDLWGDTVNLASRMETSGVPGKIQMPRSTRDLVADQFLCEERGVVDIKGKGPIEVWFLVGKTNDGAARDGKPKSP